MEDDFENQWDFESDTVTVSITLYAKWKLNQYTVSFNADGGIPAPDQQLVYHGDKANEPPEMTKGGYTFSGWYMEEDFENQWNFAIDTVTGSITLYADNPAFIQGHNWITAVVYLGATPWSGDFMVQVND